MGRRQLVIEITPFLRYSARCIEFAGSSNGRTPPFEGGYWGSNPWPAAVGKVKLKKVKKKK